MPPQAAIIKPGRPAPTIGPGTAATAVTARPMASRETPPSGREAAWAGFAELVPDTGPAVEQLPTPKVPSKGWLSALSNYPAGWLNDGLVRPAYQEARFGYVASWPIADAVATAIIATTPKPRPRLHAGIVDA